MYFGNYNTVVPPISILSFQRFYLLRVKFLTINCYSGNIIVVHLTPLILPGAPRANNIIVVHLTPLTPPPGAPRANWTSGTGSNIPNPGAVYKCPLAPDIGDPTEETTCLEQVTTEC